MPSRRSQDVAEGGPTDTPERRDWEAFKQTLTEQARRYVEEGPSALFAPPLNDDEEAFERLVATLTPAAQAYVRAQALPRAPAVVPQYCLVECPDGEWPVVKTFPTADVLAERICELQGQDCVVWAFYGVPLRLTRGPRRHLLLPDGTSLPVTWGGAGPVSAAPFTSADVQHDGFVGPPELSASAQRAPTEFDAPPPEPPVGHSVRVDADSRLPAGQRRRPD
jgi:hypothetical protein